MSRWDEPFPPQDRWETVPLERIRVAMRNILDAHCGPMVSASADLEWQAEEMALAMSAQVLGERLPPEQVVESRRFEWQYPDGWWQMWLHEHQTWPVVRWWCRRRPVRMRTESKVLEVTVDIERFRTYPKARVVLPEEQWGVQVLASATTTRAVFRQ